MMIFVPDSESLPGSIGKAEMRRNGLKNVAVMMMATTARMPAGMELRRKRTKRLCRAAARKTRSPSLRPICRDEREADRGMIGV